MPLCSPAPWTSLQVYITEISKRPGQEHQENMWKQNKVNLGETGAQSQRSFIFSLLFISHSVYWYCDISGVKDIPPPVLIVVCVNECVFYPAVLRIHTQYQRTPPECSVLPPSPSAHHPSWNTQDRADSSPSPLDTRDWKTHTHTL